MSIAAARGYAPFYFILLLRLKRNDVLDRVLASDLAVVVIDVDKPVHIAAHAELLHIRKLAQSVARFYALLKRVPVTLLKGVYEVNGSLVGGKDIK